MSKIIRLTESDLVRLVNKVIEEQTNDTSCLNQFKKTPKGSRGRFGGVTEHDYWSGTYQGYNISINFDGTCKLTKSSTQEKISAKWKCEHGSFKVYDKKQQTWTID